MPLLYVRIELLDERSDMPGDGSGERVVLVLEALPNGCQPYASIASRVYLALRRRGLNGVPTNPVVDPVGGSGPFSADLCGTIFSQLSLKRVFASPNVGTFPLVTIPTPLPAIISSTPRSVDLWGRLNLGDASHACQNAQRSTPVLRVLMQSQ